ncbi:MAG TPA: RluA family pseudouridine synthase [Candidatus Hydrogenedentes bacterium]|nr:RluA family pseudouridine synthase [Candidatus Hydrogenedentota bacterium]
MKDRKGSSGRHCPRGLHILYEDEDILVVDKSSGLLTMGTPVKKEQTAYARLMNYVRKGNAKSRKRIFIVHRLDRDVSGVLIFAKSYQAKLSLQEHWHDADKKYLAIVHGNLTEKAGTITSYLAENASHHVFSVSDKEKGKLSHTVYQVLKETKTSSLLEITLLTGRKNQIRVHLADIGHPVMGDHKYGIRNKTGGRLALHAFSIAFDHPYSGKRVSFEAPVPEYFKLLLGRQKQNHGQ